MVRPLVGGSLVSGIAVVVLLTAPARFESFATTVTKETRVCVLGLVTAAAEGLV